ncbi:MAG: glycosyltransferase [Methylococcaceae bacterium]
MTATSKQSSWLISLIERLRPDLCKMFPLNEQGERPGFAAWLVTSGIKEYQALQEDEDFLNYLNTANTRNKLTTLQSLVYEARPDVQVAYPLTAGSEHFIGWFERHGIEEHHLWSMLSSSEKNRLLMAEPWQSRYGNSVEPKILAFSERPFGVNLIGYVFGQLGIGEDLRMAARAMLAANIPFTLIDFQPGKDIPQNDRSMANYVSLEGEYAVNIFCMTALEYGRFYAERGNKQLEGRYNIGYFPWELSHCPDEWEDLVQHVDEVWVSTQHTYDAFSPVSTKPIFIMPMAVELGAISDFGTQEQTRQHFKFPTKATLFCFSFDLNSSIHRKNPQACVEAFLQAFPLDKFNKNEVGLVIKIHPPTKRHTVWEKLKQTAAKDRRIQIIQETLSRPDLLALYQCCDCFLSLHRAEGFGRGIAEAMQLGLHIITTGYSGNVDFCYAPYADLVDYKLVKIKKGQYPFGDNQVWADVDISHATKLMRAFFDKKNNDTKSNDWIHFSAKDVGLRYEIRLKEINAILHA